MCKYSWYLKFILLITLLSQIYSCAPNPQSETQLEISHSFAMTTPYFGGGLIIAGVNNTTGKTFSKALANSKSVNLKLDHGMWTIAAIGWDGGTNSALNFSGQTHCGKTLVNIKSLNEIINLPLNPSNCNLPFFNNNDSTLMETGVSPPQFKPIKLFNTCGTFFKDAVKPSDNILSKIVGGGTTSTITDFCQNAPVELRSNVQSLRIFALEKGIFQNSYNRGFLSPCLKSDLTINSKIDPASISTPANPYGSGQPLRLPFKNIPFGIAIYKDNTCSAGEQIAEFQFKDGLIDSYPKFFDHLVKNYDTNSLKIILPSNESKRALSVFEALKPKVELYDPSTMIFSKFLVTPFSNTGFLASLGYYTHHFLAEERAKIKVPNVSLCSTPTYSGPTVGFISGASPTCLIENSQAYITFQTDANSFGTLSITMGSSTLSINIEQPGFDQGRTDLQRVIINMVGHDKSFLYNLFFGARSAPAFESGYLSQIRQLFSAQFMGSLFKPISLSTTFSLACADATGTKQVTFYDPLHLSMNTYKYTLSDSPISAPSGFICNPSTRNETNCGGTIGAFSSYQKRLLFYDYKNSAVSPTIVMEFRCDELMGKMEESSKYTFGSMRIDTNKIINWTTPVSLYQDSQRYEVLESLKKFDVSGNSPQLIENNFVMGRIYKTGYTTFEGMNYEFSTKKDQNVGDFLEAFSFQRYEMNNSSQLVFKNEHDFNYETNMYDGFTTPPAFIDDLPTTLIGDMMNPSDSYPQFALAVGGVVPTLTDPTTQFSGSNIKFNGITEMKLDAFDPSGTLFSSNFGTTFFTSP